MAGPTWIRLDCAYFSNPKVLRAGRDAAMLHLAAVCYLGAHELDAGVLPAEALPALAALVHLRRPADAVDSLVEHNLWHLNGSGYIVHDYDRMNGSRSEAAAARARQRRRRARQLETEEAHGRD